MQITPILICLVLISMVQAAWVPKIPKPKFKSFLPQKLEAPEIPKDKLPEERRKFSLFPKSYMKYVISPEPIYKIATHKPVYEKKKPLMKKLNELNKKNKVIVNEDVLSTESAEPIYENNLTETPKVISASEEVSIEVVKQNSEEINEKPNNNIEEEIAPQEDSYETKMETVDGKSKESLNLTEGNTENRSLEPDTSKNSKENESADWTEFILVNPVNKTTEASPEEPEDFVTTELYEDPDIIRRKRGSNIIEEENLASTVAGYKYTGKDTRLNTEVAFKNIHSWIKKFVRLFKSMKYYLANRI